jgi:uncharacterized protein (DUF2141 family)
MPARNEAPFRNAAVTRTLALACLALVLPAAPLADSGSSVVFTFDQLKTQQGEVMVALYDAEAAYRAKTGAREARAPATAGRIRFDGLKPGRYAAMMFHDVNGDGKMNFAPLGMPLEPYAFSNNAPGRFGPAPWARSAFDVKPGETRQAIRLR